GLLRHPAELAQAGFAAEVGGWARLGELAGDATAETGAPGVPLAVDLDVQPDRQRVDHRGADAVQATGGGVGTATELPARVQPGHHQLDPGELGLALDVDRYAAAVVGHLGRAVGVQRDLDASAVPAEGLVHGVVEHLAQAMLQDPAVGGPDVHARPLAHGFQPLEDREGPGGVR